MNIMYGLAEECENRLKENFRSENSVFLKLNSLFDLLPFAALIDNKILCIHGGIGSSVNKLSDISSIRRPVQIVQDVSTPEQQLILDLVWSEYSDSVNDLAINDERDINKSGFIVKYGRDRLNRFMMENNVALLVTSHMWIAEGVKKFANDKIVVVYSATNYCDKAMNLGGLLNINKYSTTIVPKLIDIWKGDKKSYRNCKNLSPIRK
jgi:protein phosphatase